jgi:hypothetical protein
LHDVASLKLKFGVEVIATFNRRGAATIERSFIPAVHGRQTALVRVS